MDHQAIEQRQEHANGSIGIPALRSTTAAPATVYADDLSASIEDAHILHELSFRVETGRLVGLLGPNGSGKTTLLRCVSGLLPYSGTLDVLGREISAWSPRELARRMAFVRQAVSLSFDFSVSEVILLGRSPHKGWLQDYARDDRDQMVRALERVDLAGFEERSVLTLSGGELQRVFLAQALVQEAEVLLLDEPTAHLDVHYQFEFMNLIRELVGHGRTAIAVFHDLEIASRFADDLIVLQKGCLVAEGKPADVLTKALIADVFRMDASLHTSEDGTLRIEYAGPIHNETTDRSSP